MRQFSLTNKSGETYRLNSLDHFFHDPSGLGFSRDAEYAHIGNNFEILRNAYKQAVVEGSIMFKNARSNPAYNKYLKFANFLQDTPLTLHYRAARGEEYLLDVIPTQVDKTEINSSLGLDVKIMLTATSLWYLDEIKTYAGSSVTVNSDSMIESPCCLSFSGLVRSNGNISWSQSVDGVQVMTGTLSGVTTLATDIIYVRTDTNPYQIYKTASGVKTGLYDKSDFSTKRFPLIQKGANVFTVTGATSISVEGKILYETV